MNRENLFRGKRIDNGEWVEGDLSHRDWLSLTKANNGIQQYIYPYNDVISLELSYEVIPSTVGQFTGERDRTGKPIFEGDIFRLGVEKAAFEVRFEHGCFMAFNKGRQYGLVGELINAFTEIIGTIHDNTTQP